MGKSMIPRSGFILIREIIRLIAFPFVCALTARITLIIGK